MMVKLGKKIVKFRVPILILSIVLLLVTEIHWWALNKNVQYLTIFFYELKSYPVLQSLV